MSFFRKLCKVLLIMALAGIVMISGTIAVYVNYPKLKAMKRLDDFSESVISPEEAGIPAGARIIAQGEATHGNRELQELKLALLQKTAEENDVRALVLEADFGECTAINDMLQNTDVDIDDALKTLSFTLYQTEEMRSLLSWIREYNLTPGREEPITFYGADMQNPGETLTRLAAYCESAGMETDLLVRTRDALAGSSWVDFDDQKAEAFLAEYEKLSDTLSILGDDSAEGGTAKRLSRCMEQFFSLCLADVQQSNTVRDAFMAENALWISEREEAMGHETILLSAHNGHVCAWNTYDSMGVILRRELGDGYFAIGTDYRTTNCNLPQQNSRERSNHRFASADLLAAQLRRGEGAVYLDFTSLDSATETYAAAHSNIHMGSLGETYAFYMYLFPYTFRITGIPAEMYDAMILYRTLTPTDPQPRTE